MSIPDDNQLHNRIRRLEDDYRKLHRTIGELKKTVDRLDNDFKFIRRSVYVFTGLQIVTLIAIILTGGN